jgi:hypothetical protein
MRTDSERRLLLHKEPQFPNFLGMLKVSRLLSRILRKKKGGMPDERHAQEA